MPQNEDPGPTAPQLESRTIAQRRFVAFGERLSAAMRKAELTPADLSGHLRVSTQMIGKYLRGESLPGPARLQHLSEVVHVPVEELVRVADEYEARRPRTPAAYGLLSRRGSRQGALSLLTQAGVTHTVEGIPVDGLPQGALTMLASRLGDYPDIERDERLPSPRHIIADYLVDWARTAAPKARADAEVSPYPRVRGPYFRHSPALMIVDDNGPVLAVEIRSGRFNPLSSLVGQALNWKEATGGKPFFVVWLLLASKSSDSDEREGLSPEIEEALRALKNAELITDSFIVDEVDPMPELNRLTERLPGVIRETK